MPLVLEFLALDVTGLHGQGEVQTRKGLDASHAHRSSSHACRPRAGRRSCLVDLAYRADLLSQFSGVVGWWSEPGALAMRLQRAHLLKSADAVRGEICSTMPRFTASSASSRGVQVRDLPIR
jgi:hypothetical protein